MTHGDGRSSRWEATHRRIYTAAMRLFQEQGFERVNIAQLAAAAEVSIPTFYAHFPSKEHVVMQLPTRQEMAALLATQPEDLPLATRIRRAVPVWLGQWTPDVRADILARWRIIAATPALRNRAAEFERTTAGLITGSLASDADGPPSVADAVVVNAHLAAYTAGLLAWADSGGRESLEELVDAAFDAVQNSGTR